MGGDDQAVVNAEPAFYLRVLDEFGIIDWCDRDRVVLH